MCEVLGFQRRVTRGSHPQGTWCVAGETWVNLWQMLGERNTWVGGKRHSRVSHECPWGTEKLAYAVAGRNHAECV